MSKQIQSTLMLFLIGTGFLIFSLWSLTHTSSNDRGSDIIQALLYVDPRNRRLRLAHPAASPPRQPISRLAILWFSGILSSQGASIWHWCDRRWT